MVERPPVAALSETPSKPAPLASHASALDGPREAAPPSSKMRSIPDRAPVIRSKIQPPPVRSTTLSRQRLLDKLSEATVARVTLLVAEAGYGKTTLLADYFSRASVRCLWYKLDPTDADPVTWSNHLIASAREIDPTFGCATLALLGQIGPGGPPESAFVRSLLGELPRLGEAPTVLVLDDFHAVDDSAGAHQYVSQLVRDAPAWIRFVISSRRRPRLELGRLSAMGELMDIGTEDLRFSVDETARLFADMYGTPLEPEVLRDLESRTRGWAAGLQLFHGSVRGRPSTAVRALARSLSGAAKPVYDFLAQEVLNNLPDTLEEFLVRAALLDRVTAEHATSLFVTSGVAPTRENVRHWIEDADRLGLLSRVSASSDARQMHPLLREFLLSTLRHRMPEDGIRTMHLSLAESTREHDPLTASRHYAEGGDHDEAMRCLGRSVVLTVGSGQWGLASSLIDRLGNKATDPAVAAIRARRAIDEADLDLARQLLHATDPSNAPPEVRAVFRHATLSLGWRTGDRELMYSTLREIQGDDETPHVLRDISQIFVDASPLATARTALPVLAERLTSMAHRQRDAGHEFFAAISLHNAAVAYLNAGEYPSAVHSANEALALFDRLPFAAAERYSTHSILTTVHFELRNRVMFDENFQLAVQDGDEFADVAAELAYVRIATGDQKGGSVLLARAEALLRQGRTDVVGTQVVEAVRAFRLLPSDPKGAIALLSSSVFDGPLDFGHLVARRALLALAHLIAEQADAASRVAEAGLLEARDRLARRPEMTLLITRSLARGDSQELRNSITEASATSQLSILECADALADHLDLIGYVPAELEQTIAEWPNRWRPTLRRQLDKGDHQSGRVAASLLDKYGDASDVGRLRAYARTYRHRGRLVPLGYELARRVSPRLEVHDLGRVSITLGTRTIGLAAVRRKPASLLMFLVSRPSFSANRERVIDELWPETEPPSASNSLNQTLYFLRRELDPWYEEDFSVDYVSFQGDLIWLDPSLVSADSVDFVSDAQATARSTATLESVIDLLMRYRGPFAPEFEYEEWAMAWRSRVHATFLELASRTLERAVVAGDYAAARDIAVYCLDIEPENADVERRLVWLYWRLGARAAAVAQHKHLVRQEESDGLPPTPIDELVSLASPP